MCYLLRDDELNRCMSNNNAFQDGGKASSLASTVELPEILEHQFQKYPCLLRQSLQDYRNDVNPEGIWVQVARNCIRG